ncbi:hypothetical protein PAXINDRAFT_15827 [Paxillus involutus ATCC 200175]|uniref:Uncharacterized protein n=1 Tax=Paxillus involutus ATCC 200175 TaxID=664439 RepID=A0A0C9T6F3_PAXIN|nr:hypothetical protein PAXINDRAFT_15827 [Paxillus involutus ATCC 200175]
MDFNSSPYTPPHYVAALMQTQFGGPWDYHQIAAASQRGFNGNWGPEDIIMMESFAQHSVYSDMDHPAYAAITTSGHDPHTQVATASTGHECAWLEKHSGCGERFDTVPELVTHTAVAHDVRGTAGRPLTCQWDTGRGPCQIPKGSLQTSPRKSPSHHTSL